MVALVVPLTKERTLLGEELGAKDNKRSKFQERNYYRQSSLHDQTNNSVCIHIRGKQCHSITYVPDSSVFVTMVATGPAPTRVDADTRNS